MWTLQDAKNKFSAVVDAAMAGEPQEVSRRGKPAVVVISAEEFARLKVGSQAHKPSFIEHLMARPVLEGEEDWLTADRPIIEMREIEF